MTVTIVNPYAGGHYGQYLDALLRGWTRRRRPGDRLHIVAGPCVATAHPDVAALAAEVGAAWTETTTDFQPMRSRVAVEWHMARLLRTTVPPTRPDRILLTYLDHGLVAVAAVRMCAPVSGILFRPSFHYAAIGSPPEGARARLVEIAKRELLRLALRRMDRVFVPDETAVEPMRRLTRRSTPVALPEAFDTSVVHRRPAFLDALDPSRRVLLCIGALDSRKGVGVVLDAVGRLPHTLHARVALVLAGRFEASERADYLDAIDRLRRETSLQVLVEDRYLDEAEIQPTIEAADLVLVPYQRHVGSSGILIRAAVAGRPVLASDYGLVGAHVRRHRLGATVDAASPDALAAALVADTNGTGAAARFDAAAARAFASGNTSEAFAETIFRHLLTPAAR